MMRGRGRLAPFGLTGEHPHEACRHRGTSKNHCDFEWVELNTYWQYALLETQML